MTDERDSTIIAMRKAGKKHAEIADAFGLTRGRVSQILRSQGVSAITQGRYSANYGCTYDQYLELYSIGEEILSSGGTKLRTPIGAWKLQKKNASTRGISWKIGLWDWWQIWQESGKWGMRGREFGQYVMCRKGDVGAYEIGNVYIDTNRHNAEVQPNNPRRRKSFGLVGLEVSA